MTVLEFIQMHDMGALMAVVIGAAGAWLYAEGKSK